MVVIITHPFPNTQVAIKIHYFWRHFLAYFFMLFQVMGFRCYSVGSRFYILRGQNFPTVNRKPPFNLFCDIMVKGHQRMPEICSGTCVHFCFRSFLSWWRYANRKMRSLFYGFSKTWFFLLLFSAEDSDIGLGICGWLLTAFSWAIVIVTLPFSLCVCFKVRNALVFSSQGSLRGGGCKGVPIFGTTKISRFASVVLDRVWDLCA